MNFAEGEQKGWRNPLFTVQGPNAGSLKRDSGCSVWTRLAENGKQGEQIGNRHHPIGIEVLGARVDSIK